MKDKPFYLQVPFYAPHTPYDFQPEPYRKPYESSRFSCFPDEPMHEWQNPGLMRHDRDRESKLSYSALVTGVDANVGRILQRLDELRLRENTLVVFTADQGYNCGHHGVWGKGNGTIPFNLYEESIRVPLIWNHPGRIAAGQTPSPMVSSYDYFPTILDYLGLPKHRDRRLAGRSYADFLRGGDPRWRDRLYFEYSYVRGVRTRNLKLVERAPGMPSELFDIEADPGEKRSVLNDPPYRKTVDSLRGELSGFFRSAGAPPLEQWRSTTQQRLFEYKWLQL